MHRTKKPEGSGLRVARPMPGAPRLLLEGATLTTPSGRPVIVLGIGPTVALMRYLDVPDRDTVEMTLAAIRRWPGVVC